jgi:hypothetical protein
MRCECMQKDERTRDKSNARGVRIVGKSEEKRNTSTGMRRGRESVENADGVSGARSCVRGVRLRAHGLEHARA